MIQLSERQQFGRALNALSGFFVRKLVLPKVFFDVTWGNEKLDFLAIDRAGVGDVHAIRFVRTRLTTANTDFFDDAYTFDAAMVHLQTLKKPLLAAQYRYVGIVDGVGGGAVTFVTDTYEIATFAEDGIGRVGGLYVDVTANEIAIKEIIKPERFRSTAEILRLTDEYVATHTADMEYRDPDEYRKSA